MLSAVFLFCWAFVCFALFCQCSLFGLLFGLLFGFREFHKANFNGNGNEYHGCVSVRYNSSFISLPLFTKGRKTTTRNSNILRIRENLNYTTAIFSNFDSALSVLFAVFGIFLTM